MPSKGLDEKLFSVDNVVEDCKYLGYTKLLLKSDNEPSINRLGAEALKSLRIEGIEQVSDEKSVPYDPQTNSIAETGVRMVKGSIRTLQLCLERRIGHRIPVGHPLLTWLVSHAADVRNFRVRDPSGQTPHQIVTGRPFGGRLLGFGELCLFKLRSKEPYEGWGDGTQVGVWHLPWYVPHVGPVSSVLP